MRNRAGCNKCRDIIESTHRHDFVSCVCGEFSVDGGRDYAKRSFKEMGSWTELSSDDALREFEAQTAFVNQLTEPIDIEEIRAALAVHDAQMRLEISQ